MLEGHISFDTEVSLIDKIPDSGDGGGGGGGSGGSDGLEEDAETFSVSTTKGDWTCTRVIIATGLSTPTPMPDSLNHPGRAVQVDSINTRVESAHVSALSTPGLKAPMVSALEARIT
jgi:hypothetical protein